VFVNPPYAREIGKWVKKSYEEGKKDNTVVVMLIPARTDTKYFHDYIYGKSEIRFIKGRLRFVDLDANGIQKMSPAPFPSMLVIFRQQAIKKLGGDKQ
jgi:site-specific DNA-methyltransferase (adenine-specific)